MKRQRHSKRIAILVIVAFIMVIGWATSETWAAEAKYPSRLIEIVVGFSPGTTDVALRTLVDYWPKYLGQPYAFVYMPGSMGSRGASFVAKSKPDGYTLYGTPSSSLHGPVLTQEGLDYTSDDLVPICRVATTPFEIVVKADSPFKTPKDIVEAAKKSPGKLSYSSAGLYGAGHISMEMFLRNAGIKITHVPCTGSAQAITALLGGHVSMSSSSMAPASPHIKSGALRSICLYEKKRLKEFPNIPTAFELGYPVIMNGGYLIMAPKRTPKEVANILIMASKKAAEDHKNSIEDKLKKIMLEFDFVTGEDLGREIKEEYEKYKEVINELKKSIK